MAEPLPGKTPVVLLAAMAVASPVALNIFAPVMPELVDTFNTSSFTIQLGFTLYLLTLSRRPVDQRSAGRPLRAPPGTDLGFRPAYSRLPAWNNRHGDLAALTGPRDAGPPVVAPVCCWPALLFLTQQSRDKAAGMLGYITLGIASAQALAPTLGGYLNIVAGWQSVFWLSMLLGTLVWFGALLKLPETVQGTAQSQGIYA